MNFFEENVMAESDNILTKLLDLLLYLIPQLNKFPRSFTGQASNCAKGLEYGARAEAHRQQRRRFRLRFSQKPEILGLHQAAEHASREETTAEASPQVFRLRFVEPVPPNSGRPFG